MDPTEAAKHRQKAMGAEMLRRTLIASLGLGPGVLSAISAEGKDAKNYGPGVSDTEIRLGQFAAFSGPLSSYSAQNKAGNAFFDMINDQGGVNGRRIKIVSLDDGYVPSKTVEVTRQLVENDRILGMYMPMGTPTNAAVHKYLNLKKVPQLFITSGAVQWGDPKNYPWTMGWLPSFQAEGRIFANYAVKTHPNAKVAVLYQNDDFGKDYLKGVKDGFGDRVKTIIVSEQSYETADASIESQVINLKASGADVLINLASNKFAAMTIRKIHDLGWKPVHLLNSPASGIASTLEPAGLDNSTGIITADFIKDPSDPRWKDDPATVAYLAFLKKWLPQANPADRSGVVGYSIGQTMLQVLKQCGDDLTRENLMKQAASLNLDLPMLLPGIKVQTSPSDFFPIEGEYLTKFDGTRWVVFSDLLQ
jgi:branched-chain amino acid transport system substrate-binding protein